MLASLYVYAHGIDFKQRTNLSKHDVNPSGDILFHFQSKKGLCQFCLTSFIFDSVLTNNLKSEEPDRFSQKMAEVQLYLDKDLVLVFLLCCCMGLQTGKC